MIKKILGTIGKSVVSGGSFEIPTHDSPLFAKIDWEKLPRHVAVIMDYKREEVRVYIIIACSPNIFDSLPKIHHILPRIFHIMKALHQSY